MTKTRGISVSSTPEGAGRRHIGVRKLDDANLAGTARSAECTLILTEGDSAKALAMAGRSVVGSDRYGVFRLKGTVTQQAKAFKAGSARQN